jgi:hypothetical protein
MAQSRVEAILEAKANGTEYTATPLSRVEEMLIDLDLSGGGTVDDTVIADIDALKAYAVTDSEFNSNLGYNTVKNVAELKEHALLDSDGSLI